MPHSGPPCADDCQPQPNVCHRLTQPGSTDKQGPAWLRWVLNQAAQTAKRSPDFAGPYAAIAKRRGTKIATIAVSRKLLTRAYHLLAAQAASATASAPADQGGR